jgi:hypothetical protein
MLERLTCRLGNVDDPRPSGLLRIGGIEVEVGPNWVKLVPSVPVARVERALGVLIREVLGAGLRELTPFEKARIVASRSDGAMLVVEADCTDDQRDEYLYSADLRYRYRFDRTFASTLPGRATWILANPGTGDTNDGPRPTLRNAINISRAHGCGRITIVNLAARRSARLADLPVGEEVVGPHNLREVAAAARDATVVVAAWGNAASRLHLDAAAEMTREALDRAGVQLHVPADSDGRALLTGRGHPMHPLRLNGRTRLVAWPARSSPPVATVMPPAFTGPPESPPPAPHTSPLPALPPPTPRRAAPAPTLPPPPPIAPSPSAPTVDRLTRLIDAVARRGYTSAGVSEHDVDAFAAELQRQVVGDEYAHSAIALQALLSGEVHILDHGGATPIPIGTVLYELGRAGVGPEKAARALVLGAVAVGGCTDRVRPAWQHCQDYGNVTRGGIPPDHPVKGVNSPSGARALYNLLIGRPGAPGTVATQSRGVAERR